MPDLSLFTEKRALVRFPVTLPLVFRETYLNNFISAQTLDLSAGGLSMVTDRLLFSGEGLEIFINMRDNNEQIRQKGVVVWSNTLNSGKYRVGIRFAEGNLKPIPLILRTLLSAKQ